MSYSSLTTTEGAPYSSSSRRCSSRPESLSRCRSPAVGGFGGCAAEDSPPSTRAAGEISAAGTRTRGMTARDW